MMFQGAGILGEQVKLWKDRLCFFQRLLVRRLVIDRCSDGERLGATLNTKRRPQISEGLVALRGTWKRRDQPGDHVLETSEP